MRVVEYQALSRVAPGAINDAIGFKRDPSARRYLLSEDPRRYRKSFIVF
jgi:hypothetical protein